MEIYLAKHLPHFLASIGIFIGGIIIAYIFKKLVRRWLLGKNNSMVKAFISNFTYIVILIVAVIATLSNLGVPTASILTVLGAAGLAIALALKSSLSNVASGFLIVFLKPFKVGDTVNIAGNTGTVMDINLFVTELKTATNEALYIPNHTITDNSIINKTRHKTRRLDLTIGISYNADISQAKSVMQAVINQSNIILNDPAPVIAVDALADSSVNIIVKAWTKTSDLMQAQYDLNHELKDALDKANIEIPYPHMDISLKREN